MLSKKKFLFTILTAFLGTLMLCPVSYGQEKTVTTTVETIQPTPAPRRKGRRAPAPAPTVVTTTTTVVTPPPPREVVRKVYDEETLKKISKTLCTEGFKAYVGTAKKNVCKSKAAMPDIAFTCVWNKKGPSAFAPTPQGPCNLDYAEHQGSIIMKKETFPDDPPLDYGVEAQCCFRAAKGFEPATHTAPAAPVK